jgi:hypothetical protein
MSEYPRWKHGYRDDGGLDSRIVNSVAEEDRLGEAYFDSIGDAKKFWDKRREPKALAGKVEVKGKDRVKGKDEGKDN